MSDCDRASSLTTAAALARDSSRPAPRGGVRVCRRHAAAVLIVRVVKPFPEAPQALLVEAHRLIDRHHKLTLSQPEHLARLQVVQLAAGLLAAEAAEGAVC